MNPNPILKADFPDPDVIRVGDTYYMVTTTMHFMPGCEILRSYDLIHWEHAAYVYETLDSTPGQRLEGKNNIYGKGMWAASLRWHKGRFYVCFVANDTGKTYLFHSDRIQGPWQKQVVNGFYHDCSLLFDDDGKKYIIYGNDTIWLTQLKEDMSGPLEGGLHRKIISDHGNPFLGYEGSHIYKIKGKYYVFLIHSRRDRWMRTEACFMADTLEGEFIGKDILEDDRDYCGQGVAQGGIVDTCDGDWYAVLFQDHGAVGRIPVLIPVTWENDFPVLGEAGKVPEEITTNSTRPGYRYRPLWGSDDFICEPDQKGCCHLDARWQFNHEPDPHFFEVDGINGRYILQTSKLCSNLTQAQNTITQRMRFPVSSAEVTIDASCLLEGDYAGLCALQGCYGMAAVTKREGCLWAVMKIRRAENGSLEGMEADDSPGEELGCIPLEQSLVRFRAEADFWYGRDEVRFVYYDSGIPKPLGSIHKLYFKMDHFTGCRFGLFLYATKQTGGKAAFSNFQYE